ncbi:MAG: DUF1186 domain-containing protein [Verrucomicrobiales bacterium]|nr:DUF1186 domain-containing protein [Verrucomicrobiales bacterium]
MANERSSRDRLELQGAGFLERFGFPEWVLPVIWFEVPVDRRTLEMIHKDWELVSAAFLRLMEELVGGKAEEVLTVGGVLHVYAMLYAAEKRDVRFAEPLLKLARRSGDELDEMFGEGVTDDFPAWFAEVCGDDPEALMALVLDAEVDEFVRSGAFEALLWLCDGGRLERDEMVKLVGRAFVELEREASYIWCELTEIVAALGLEEQLPEVRRAFDDGLIDKRVFKSMDAIQELFDEGGAEPRPAGRYKVLDVIEEYEERALEQEARHTPVTVEPKVGRNDPCPCGSGKKYKKCCG